MSNEELKARVDTHTKICEMRMAQFMREASAAQKLHAICVEIEGSAEQTRRFVVELERLGETDANAGKIIQLAQAHERLLTLVGVIAQSILDLQN